MVKDLWNRLTIWLNRELRTHLILDPKSMLFNAYEGFLHQIINMIILVAKYYMYANKFNSDTLSFNALKSRTLEYKLIEECIAKKKNKLERHFCANGD